MSKALQFIHSIARKLLAQEGKGITSIANRLQAEAKAGEIAETFRLSGLTPNKWNEFIKSEKDVVKYLNIIEESKKKPIVKFDNDDLSTMSPDSAEGKRISELLMGRKKADVFDLKGNRIKNTNNIMGGEEIKIKDPALYEDRGGNIIPTQFSEAPAFPSYTAKETDAQILKRLKKQNKDAAERLKNKKKKLDEPDDMATGGRAGYYGGGQASTGMWKDMVMGLGVPPSGNYAGGTLTPEPSYGEPQTNNVAQGRESFFGQPLFDKDGFRLGDQRYGTGLVGGPFHATLPSSLSSVQTPGGPMQSPTMGFQPTNAQGGESSKQMGIGSLPGNFQPTQNVAPGTQPQATFNSFDQIVNPDLKDQREQALLNLNNEFFSTPSYDPPQVPEEQKITDPYQQSESYKRQQDTTPVTTPDEVRNKGNTVAQAFGAKPGALNQALGLAYGGRAGLYQGGQAQIEPDLSGIGHGSDALMARNMLIAPGSQATTSTGLNYLLGEDNDTTRVPYNEGLKVEGPDPRILELMLNEKMSYEEALKEFENRMKQQPYIDERYNMGPGPILEAAEGGRIGYKEAGPVVLPKPKPKPNADPLIELQRIYDLYQESMPGVSQETQKYLQQDFIQKLNDAGISQEQFMTNQMQNNFAEGGPARQNFKMGKRAFLQWMFGTGAGIAGIKTGLLGLGKKTVAKSVIAPAAQAANEAGIPPYFFKLVNKIKLLGDDVTETSALTERQTVKRYKDFELTEDTATGRIEIQRVKVADRIWIIMVLL
jgi:hypothetical protein